MTLTVTQSTFRPFLAAAVVLVCTATSRGEMAVSGTIVGARVDAPYSYGRVNVQNHYGREMSYRLEIRNHYFNQRIEYFDQSLGAGLVRVYHVPLLKSGGGWQVRVVDADGRSAVTGMNNENLQFLHVSSLQERATAAEIERFSKMNGTDPPHSYGGSPDTCVSQLSPKELPDNWLCYCPFHAVFVHDPAWAQLAPTERKALEQWVRAGGRLVIYGHAGSEREETQMLGTVQYMVANPIENEATDGQWPREGPTWETHAREASSLDSVPYTVARYSGGVGGLSLATLFFVIAGPLNYWYFARRNRIRALLITLPLASVACCLLITGFFLVTQGFAKRGGSLALIVLDEEIDSAITFSRHVFYSGLYPLGGFRFTRDTAFCPLGTYGDRESFALDLTEEQQLRAGLFSPSVSFHYLTVRHWTTRAKLVWDLDDMTVLNGFDGEAERVVLRVGNKAYEASRVPAGGKAKLTELPTPVPGDRALVQLALNRDAPPDRFVLGRLSGILTSRFNQTASSTDQGRATYVIVFSRPPVDLNAGLTMRGDNAFCALFGESVLQSDTAR